MTMSLQRVPDAAGERAPPQMTMRSLLHRVELEIGNQPMPHCHKREFTDSQEIIQ